jgi:hypothetical protein
MSEDPFFVIRDNRSPGVRLSRVFTNDDPDQYLGYYENENGVPFVFSYSRRTKEAFLYFAEDKFHVIDGQTDEPLFPEVQRWLNACWRACVLRAWREEDEVLSEDEEAFYGDMAPA